MSEDRRKRPLDELLSLPNLLAGMGLLGAVPYLQRKAQGQKEAERLSKVSQEKLQEQETWTKESDRTIANGFTAALVTAQQCIGIAVILGDKDLRVEALRVFTELLRAHGKLTELVNKINEASANESCNEEGEGESNV